MWRSNQEGGPIAESSADNRFTLFEARLFAASPLGMWPTILLIFAITYGGFLAISLITQQPPPFERAADGRLVLEPVTWVAMVLSLILTAALGLSESGRRMWRQETPDLIAALKPGAAQEARNLAEGAPRDWRPWYTGFMIAGAAAGLGFNFVLVAVSDGFTLPLYVQSIGLWFILASPPLYALGLRAGVDLARESGEIRALIRDHLDVDLLHLQRLHVFGRIGLRGALNWMVMAAIMLLFLLNPSGDEMNTPFTLIALGLAAIGGAVVFISAVNPVRQAVKAAKQAEIEAVRIKIGEEKSRLMAEEAAASGRLSELFAYEAWLEKRPEWPISAPVTTRFGLYVLIPVIPWFGSALADRLIASLQGG